MNALLLSLALASAPAAEVARIQQHLDGALTHAGARDLSTLSEAQRERRQLHLERLVTYRDEGRFPRNRDFPHQRVPYFRDADGTLCAMAYLLWESGEEALVESVVHTRNNATVHQLADEPGLAAWLEANGLTLEEAARIQPGYDFYEVDLLPPTQAVTPGACSPEVAVQVAWRHNGEPADDQGSVFADSETVTFFSDAACETDLGTVDWQGGRRANVEATGGEARFHFLETAPGALTLTLRFGDSTAEHTFAVGTSPDTPGTEPEPDPGAKPLDPTLGEEDRSGGCAGVPGPFVLAGALSALPLWRRRRAA